MSYSQEIARLKIRWGNTLMKSLTSKINLKNLGLIDASIKRIMRIYGLLILPLFTEKYSTSDNLQTGKSKAIVTENITSLSS